MQNQIVALPLGKKEETKKYIQNLFCKPEHRQAQALTLQCPKGTGRTVIVVRAQWLA